MNDSIHQAPAPAPKRGGALRIIIPVLLTLALVGGLAAIKAQQIGMLLGFVKEMQKAGPPPTPIGDATAKKATWESTISAVGGVEAGKGVTVTNDLPGVVTAIKFDSGSVVKKGDILLELDSSVERAQLASAIARRDLAKATVKRSQALSAASILAASQLEADEASVKTSAADAQALGATIARKIVRAPFSGKLGIRAVNLGQYLNPGTAITVLESTEDTVVDFTIPQQRLADVKVGSTVRFTLGEGKKTLEGAVAAIEPTVDASTRAAKLRASAQDPDKLLRPGMFVNVAVVLGEKREVVVVPVTAVVHASYGDSIFVIEEKDGKKIARQQFVRTGELRGDFIAVEDGLKGGEDIVSVGAFKLRNGGGVTIDNTNPGTKPEASPHPKNR